MTTGKPTRAGFVVTGLVSSTAQEYLDHVYLEKE